MTKGAMRKMHQTSENSIRAIDRMHASGAFGIVEQVVRPVLVALSVCVGLSLSAPVAIAQSNEVERFLVVTDNEAQLLATANAAAPTVSDPLAFGAKYTVEDRQADFYLITLEDGTSGWLQDKNGTLLTNADIVERGGRSGSIPSLRVSPYGDDTEALPSAAATWRKIVILNDIGTAKRKAEKQTIPRIKVYGNPRRTGAPIVEVTIFELLYLYDTYQLGRDDGSEGSVLVGIRRYVTPRSSSPALQGWIAEGHVKEWNNRLGVEFDKDTYAQRKANGGLANAYFSSTDAANALAPDSSTAIESIRSEEDTDEAMVFIAPRFPILKQSGHVRGSDIYEIVIIGAGFSGSKRYTAADVARARENITKATQGKVMRLAILLDATRGMKDVIVDTKKAVQAFLTEMQTLMEVQIAIAIYKDFPDAPPHPDTQGPFWVMTDFTSDAEKIAAALDAIQVGSSVGDAQKPWAYPEAVLFGIDAALSRLTWGQERDKYLVIIGDHGNHRQKSDYEGEFERLYPLARHHKKPEEVLKRLQEEGVYPSAMHVNTKDTTLGGSEVKQFVEDYARQMRTLIGRDRSFQSFVLPERDSFEEYTIALQLIGHSFELTRLFYEVKLCLAQRRKDCGAKEEYYATQLAKLTSYQGQFEKDVLERDGVDIEALSAQQLAITAYVSRNNVAQINQLKVQVLASRNTLENLKSAMVDLTTAIAQASNNKKADELKKAVSNIVLLLTGDEPGPDDILSDFIEARQGLPLQTPALDQTIEELVAAVIYGGEGEAYSRDFGTSIVKLDGVLLEKEVIQGEFIPEAGRFEYSFVYDEDDREVRRYWFHNFETPIVERLQDFQADPKRYTREQQLRRKYAWIPIEFLP